MFLEVWMEVRRSDWKIEQIEGITLLRPVSIQPHSSLGWKKLASFSLTHACLDENATDLGIPRARELLLSLAEELNSFYFRARCFAPSLISLAIANQVRVSGRSDTGTWEFSSEQSAVVWKSIWAREEKAHEHFLFKRKMQLYGNRP